MPLRVVACVFVAGNRTEARERERAEGTVSSLPGTLNVSDAIPLELRDRVVGSGPAQQAMLSEGSDPASAQATIRTKIYKKKNHPWPWASEEQGAAVSFVSSNAPSAD